MDNASETLRKIKELTDHVYELKLIQDKAEKTYKAEKAKLCEIMESAEVDKMQGDTCTASLSLKSSVSVPKEHASKKELFDYIKKTYSEDVLFDMLTINARTFGSWYTAEINKKALEGEFDFKLDMLNPHEYYSIGLRKRAVKKDK